MRRARGSIAIRALLLGTAATGAVCFVAAAGLALAVAATDAGLRVGVGALVLVEVAQSPGESAVSVGPGLAVVALCGGLANAAAALVLTRRRGGGGPIA